MADNLTVIKNGNSYTLPVGWGISDHGNIEFNAKLENKAFVHGSDLVGDLKVKGRTITVEFDVSGATEEEFNDAINTAYFYLTGEFDLKVGRTDRVYHVAACQKIKTKEFDGFKQRWLNIEVVLMLANPFRYATTETKIANVYTEAQTVAEITFSNPSSVDVPVIFKFAPQVSMADITIEHVESGQSFGVKDTLLTNPAILTVDGENGTVWRDTNNAINAFSGLFLRALPGSNTFKFTGDAGTVELIYTAGWFV